MVYVPSVQGSNYTGGVGVVLQQQQQGGLPSGPLAASFSGSGSFTANAVDGGAERVARQQGGGGGDGVGGGGAAAGGVGGPPGPQGTGSGGVIPSTATVVMRVRGENGEEVEMADAQ